MKFKALFAGVLIGAIALSSCVKNVESPEVTALRNARADEIRALAEYHRAEAAAATTLANAQAALDQAQAAYNEIAGDPEKLRLYTYFEDSINNGSAQFDIAFIGKDVSDVAHDYLWRVNQCLPERGMISFSKISPSSV